MPWTNPGVLQIGEIIIDSGGTELLVYAGVPAYGNLILAIAAVAGTDEYGNSYEPGITMPALPTSSTVSETKILFPDNTVGIPGQLIAAINTALDFSIVALEGPANAGQAPGPALELILDKTTFPAIAKALLTGDAVTLNAPTINLGASGGNSNLIIAAQQIEYPNAPVGGYYCETAGIGQNPVGQSATVSLYGYSSALYGIYPTGWSVSKQYWTPPAIGVYEICVYVVINSSLNVGALLYLKDTVSGLTLMANYSPASSNNRFLMLSGMVNIQSLNQLGFYFQNNSYATNINPGSYIITRRVL